MKIHQIKKASRQCLKGNVKKSAVLLIYIILNVAVLTAVPYLLNNHVSSFTGILAACAAVLILNLFSYSTFMTGRSAWFLFYKKKKRLLKTIYWFSPSRLSKSLGTYLSLLVRKAALASAFLLPGAAIIVSAVILALNGGVEFNLFVSWIAGGGVILISGAVFMMIVIQRYFLVPYIRVENPKMKSKEIFALSRREMNGNMKKAFLLKLSFAPLFLICLTVLPIPYVWSYYNQSCALLAKSLRKSEV